MTNLLIALSFIAFDIITGLGAAIKNGTYKSSKMREGLFHKCGEILAIVFAYLCEFSFPLIGITISVPICHSILIYIIIMEIGSIIENIGLISPEVKNVLAKTFKSYGKDSTENEDEEH